MGLLEEVQFCAKCVNPKGFNVKNPVTNSPLEFFKYKGKLLCEICLELFSTNVFPDKTYFQEEFDRFLHANKQVLFAYSGGLDSTVALINLRQICIEKHITLETFTILTGVKGRMAFQNVNAVISHLGLEENHVFIDIENDLQDVGNVVETTKSVMTTFDVYKYCFENSILPCGKICNAMLDAVYKKTMQDKGHDTLITGGDTPKLNEKGLYSIFWKKKSDITIVRGGFALGLDKKTNADFIAKNNIPWIHPLCGGYDTDCLVPGAHFYKALDGDPKIAFDRLLREFPIILEYLSERVRFGAIDRDQAIRQLEFVDICSLDSMQELVCIFNKENTSKGD